MKLRNLTVHEIKNLPPDELLKVYNFIINIKEPKPSNIATIASSEIRELLKNTTSSLSEDIISDRDDRL
jgi:hypothetical protein